MPYTGSASLPFESASKLGHISVVNDPFIRQMVESFREVKRDPTEKPSAGVSVLDTAGIDPLGFVLAVDGSLSTIPNALAPQKMLSYVKLAAMLISMAELARVQAPIVDPEAVQQILSKNADTESTVLPLSNVRIPGKTLFETIRHALEATFCKLQEGALYDTLEYLVSYAWDADAEPWRAGSAHRPYFMCPICEARVNFPRHAKRFKCRCSADLTLVDYLGLMMDVNEASNDAAVAVNLMGVLEHLLFFTFVRDLVKRGMGFHDSVILLKDGPLMLRGQYARLIDPIRGYLRHLHDNKLSFFIAGVEKDGAFAEHIAQMNDWFKGDGVVFVPDNQYILNRIKHTGAAATRYGEKVLYGSKVYVRIDARNVLVLNVPNRRHDWNSYDPDARIEDLIGFDRIVATLKKLVSRQFQNALLPIVAVNRLASMSFYPSNNILERFTSRIMPSDAKAHSRKLG